jgi:penicillin-binding protein-related factor A (putative recombinase)
MDATGGCHYKIRDLSGLATAKQPFDLFGAIKDAPAYVEVKFNKTTSSFNLNRIEPHQADWLDKFSRVNGAICLVILGVHVKRGDLRSYVFNWKSLATKYREKHSYWWKDLEKLPYNEVKKGVFTFENVIE